MGKTEVKVSPLDDSILDIRVVYSFSKYKNWDEHLDDVLEYMEDLPDMKYIKHEFQFRKQTGGVVENSQELPRKSYKELRESLIEDWMKKG